MLIKIISGLLILITVYLNLKHGWAALTIKTGDVNLFTELHFSRTVQLGIGVLTIISALLIMLPATYFTGNLLNAAIILLIMAFLLKEGNLKAAAIEIPFLLLPLIMIYLGHPFKAKL